MVSFQQFDKSGAPSTILGRGSSTASRKQPGLAAFGDYEHLRSQQARKQSALTEKASFRQSPERNIHSAMSSDTEDYSSPMRPANICAAPQASHVLKASERSDDRLPGSPSAHKLTSKSGINIAQLMDKEKTLLKLTELTYEDGGDELQSLEQRLQPKIIVASAASHTRYPVLQVRSSQRVRAAQGQEGEPVQFHNGDTFAFVSEATPLHRLSRDGAMDVSFKNAIGSSQSSRMGAGDDRSLGGLHWKPLAATPQQSSLARHRRQDARSVAGQAGRNSPGARTSQMLSPSQMELPARAGSSFSNFRPRRRDLDQEMPRLRKKYEGGFWGYGKRIKRDSQSPTKNAKILLSQAKRNQHEFSFSNLYEREKTQTKPVLSKLARNSVV